MVNYLSSFAQIIEDFRSKGIPVDIPGFYDHQNFIIQEKLNPNYLNNYAAFVAKRSYSSQYIDKAKNEIAIMAELMRQELVKDGRLGACIDISLVLSKILEEEGYWNYIVKGALTLIFPSILNISRKYFWPCDTKSPAIAGHVWIAAPPFSVIDITVKKQPFEKHEEVYLPDMVLESTTSELSIDTIDIFNRADIDIVQQRSGIEESDMIARICPHIYEMTKVFKPTKVNHNGVTLKYIPCAISAPNENLKNITSLCLNDMNGNEIYQSIIKPKLEEHRNI
ncbi:MAG: hypothetical protein A2328_10895 [Bdellovibrionales bacterium RIFOXYB2_FULL_36_6]|nr:MAG: hypothetical protein A2328_10895 [Bdellovibrionales bacterium RIFOXYB2_FULL_36_6]